MNIKINTKEKFTVIYLLEPFIAANMAVDIENLATYGKETIPHVIINMAAVAELALQPALALEALQQSFYEQNLSFVICEMQAQVELFFETNQLLDDMNVTPTESEAWDIIQMEEIERELLDDYE